ncbi:MAG TPA: low molecular weight phosphatase family protein [Dermatophilaceae bacterium]|nr:low molecular weight phosphatase family protein [Dermatophilaceae bacterium]
MDPTGPPLPEHGAPADRLAGGRVLVVCTGNICRSPYVERRLCSLLAGSGVSVRSAGTSAAVGRPMSVESGQRLAALGGDASGFSARQLDEDLVAEADLVVTAARAHVAPVVRLHLPALRRTFALADLADLLSGVPAEQVRATSGDTRAGRVAALAVARRGLVVPRRVADADIVDPIGRPPRVYDRMVREVEAVLPSVVAALRA